VWILVTFHYSLLLVTSAVGIRYLGFVTLIVTQALRAQRGSPVAAAVILIPNSISATASSYLLAPHATAESGKCTRAHMDQKKTEQLQIQNPSFIAL